MSTPKPLWERLQDLNTFEKSVQHNTSDLQKTLDLIESYKKKIPSLHDLEKENKQELYDAQKKVQELESLAAQLKLEEENKRSALETTQKSKNHEALSRELKQCEKKRSELDDQLIEAWHHLDLMKKTTEEKQQSLHQELETITQALREEQEKIKEREQELLTLKERRPEYTHDIPEPWLSRYMKMKDHLQDPLAKIHNNVCSACFYTVNAQDRAALKRQAIVTCKNCFRLLYEPQEYIHDIQSENTADES